jgi:hypothetical protein
MGYWYRLQLPSFSCSSWRTRRFRNGRQSAYRLVSVISAGPLETVIASHSQPSPACFLEDIRSTSRLTLQDRAHRSCVYHCFNSRSPSLLLSLLTHSRYLRRPYRRFDLRSYPSVTLTSIASAVKLVHPALQVRNQTCDNTSTAARGVRTQ